MGVVSIGQVIVIVCILLVVVISRARVVMGIRVASRIYHLGLVETRAISVILHSAWGFIPIAIVGAEVWPITARERYTAPITDQWIQWFQYHAS